MKRQIIEKTHGQIHYPQKNLLKQIDIDVQVDLDAQFIQLWRHLHSQISLPILLQIEKEL